MQKIIGRQKEIAQLEAYVQSGRAEFIAVYGRRRVGKTFLIDQLLKKDYTFSMTGIVDGGEGIQIKAFTDALSSYGYECEQQPQNWFDAFVELRHFLNEKMQPSKRCFVFIDELPCLDTKGRKLVEALGYFWNSWASKQDNIMLIVCGSATSWMIRNIIDNKGGLHNRITHEIHLSPFNLKETEEFLISHGVVWDRLSILQSYMMMGGVPFYLEMIQPNMSLAQNIDLLFFSSNGELRREFRRLYRTLFHLPENYIAIIKLLAAHKTGLTRTEIAALLGKNDNGHLSEQLDDLINCDFIRLYNVKNKKIAAKNGIYQLVDFYSIFHLTFATKDTSDEHYWSHHLHTPEINTWFGLTFERICLTHIEQIKNALHIGGMATEHYSWRSAKNSDTPAAQIDLIIERADRIINVCEIKYSEFEYTLNKEEYLKIMNRIEAFRSHTRTRYAIWPIMITTFGLKDSAYASSIPQQILLDALFAEV